MVPPLDEYVNPLHDSVMATDQLPPLAQAEIDALARPMPPHWLRWTILSFVAALSLLVAPTVTTAHLTTFGGRTSLGLRSGEAVILLHNGGRTPIEVQRVELRSGGIRVRTANLPVSISAGATKSLRLTVEPGDCRHVARRLTSVRLHVAVEPVGLHRSVDVEAFDLAPLLARSCPV